jgi:glycosyltransferase involved in cell wall biosynthesis
MRCIHVTEQVDYPWGGLSYSIPSLCSALAGRGHDVALATLTDNMERPRPSYQRCFSPLNPKFPPIQLGRSPAMKRWMNDEARSGGLDAIHVHALWRFTSVFPCHIGKKFGVPVVLAPRGSLAPDAMRIDARKKRLFWLAFQRPALNAATCFHATAESEAEQIRSLGFRQPIALIPNGVDIPEEGCRHHQSPRELLYLGRVHRIKGLDDLLRAWATVESQRPDWRLRIVGPDDGGHLPELKALAASLRLERVTFERPAEGEARRELYSHASIYILPSRSENFGMTVAEALAAGTPVIVSMGAPWSGIERENCGWWIGCSVPSLTEVLLRVTSMAEAELDAMGGRGRAWMDREFGWKPVAAKVEELYRWLKADKPACDRPRFVLE